MAASTREATIAQESPIAISQLPFVAQRLPLLQPGLRDANDRKRAGDRTCGLVGRWKILSDDLPKIRSQTVLCLQATEDKKGAVVLKIADREEFDNLQSSIKNYEEQIARLETAIRELDEMHAGFLSEMQDTRSSLATVENQQQQMLSGVAANALQRGARLRQSPEAILQADEIYQETRKRVESQVATAKQNLAKLEPEIEKIEAILAGVGC